MPQIVTAGLIIFAVLAFVSALYFGYQATISSIGPAKGHAHYRATTLVGLGLCLCATSMIVDKCTHPLFAFGGTLLSQRIIHSDSKHFSDYLQIQTAQGGEITVHLSDRLSLSTGQKLWVQYESDSGEVRRMRYYSDSGVMQNDWKSPWPLQAGFFFLFGLFFMWGARRKLNRDPEDQDEPIQRDSPVTSTVDEDSLLHLNSRK
jgi:hypothetical protein